MGDRAVRAGQPELHRGVRARPRGWPQHPGRGRWCPGPVIRPKVGAAGEVVSTLRPAGKVIINQDIYDAITDGIFLEKGTTIVVKRIEGSVLVVEEG